MNALDTCLVCGARRPANAFACDRTCERAWEEGRTRAQQIKVDLRDADEQDGELLEADLAAERQSYELQRDTNYNSPEFN